MTHTPGPWEVGYRAMDVGARDEKGWFKVCDIRGWGHLTGNGHGALGLPHDEAVAIQTANANLIAAAPDLLDAARVALAYMTGGMDGDWRDCDPADLLRAAIAKATEIAHQK